MIRWPKKREIFDRAGERIFLTRWYLLRVGSWALMLHKMHRPDDDSCHHDHPWSFITFVLAGGYIEEVTDADGTVRTRHNRPGMILYRPAEHTHRIKVLPAGTCYTLVLRFSRRRNWGFHTPRGWVYWERFLRLRSAVQWCEKWRRED